MKRVVAVVALISLMSTANAEDTEIGKLMGGALHAAFSHMALAYVCRDQVGIAHYQAARIEAETTMRLIGSSSDEAILAVDTMDKKFQNDPRGMKLDASAGCRERLVETQRDVEVWQAKVRSFRKNGPNQ